MTENRNSHEHLPNDRAALSKLANDLLSALPEGQWRENQDHLLDFLVERAVGGADLSKAYPEAYQLLLKDAHMRETFIDLVDSIEAERAGELPNLPPMGEIELGFLHDVNTPLRVEQTGPSAWRVLLRRTAEELKNLYKPRKLVYRAPEIIGNETWLSLVRDDIDIHSEFSLAISLEMARSSNPDELSLFFSVATNSPPEGQRSDYQYHLQVNWGSYQGAITVGETFRAQLPSIPVASIEDDFRNDLMISLNLEPRNRE